MMSISPMYSSTKVLVHRNAIIYFMYRLSGTCIFNIVAERMRYPHPFFIFYYFIQYNFSLLKNRRWAC